VTLRTPDDRFSALVDYPFDPHFADWDGMRVHYLDEGVGPVVVLFHGEPTWSFLYRNVLPPLVEAGFRVIAPDYPGFGRSDKPTDPAFYSYDRMVQSMIDLCDSLEIEAATAVVQDWGGPIGLRTAVDRRERFRRLVILNTGLFTGSGRVTPAFEAWRSFVEKTPDLPIERIMRNASVGDWGTDVLAGYAAPFPTAEHKVGAWRLPLIVPLAADDPGAAEMLAVRDALATWSDPVLVLFADQDPIFTTRVGERFADAIPGAGPLETISGAGHFLQEDKPQAVASAILDFLDRT
jgi:haloalkane dehalogenase